LWEGGDAVLTVVGVLCEEVWVVVKGIKEMIEFPKLVADGD